MNTITIWLKIGKSFIDEGSIKSLKRFGEKTKIYLLSDQVVIVDASYEKVIEMLPSGKF